MSKDRTRAERAADARETYYREVMAAMAARFPGQYRESYEVILTLLYTYSTLENHFIPRMAAVGLSPSGFNVLNILNNSGVKGRPLHEIGDLMLVSRANITGLIDNLEKKGLVERIASLEDRRVKIARITRSGRSLLKSFMPDHIEEIHRICSGLTSAERTGLASLLNKLQTSINRSENQSRAERHRK